MASSKRNRERVCKRRSMLLEHQLRHHQRVFDVKRRGRHLHISYLPYNQTVSLLVEKDKKLSKRQIEALCRRLAKHAADLVVRANRCATCDRKLRTTPGPHRGHGWRDVHRRFRDVGYRCLYCHHVFCQDCADRHFAPDIGPFRRRPRRRARHPH